MELRLDETSPPTARNDAETRLIADVIDQLDRQTEDDRTVAFRKLDAHIRHALGDGPYPRPDEPWRYKNYVEEPVNAFTDDPDTRASLLRQVLARLPDITTAR